MVANNILNTSTVPIAVAEGGSGIASNTAYAVLCGGTSSTSAIQSIAGLGSSGQCLTSNGAALPTFQTKNTYIVGTTTNDDAAAGNLGEFIFSELALSSAITLTTNVAQTVTSISLTAGDWDVYGEVAFLPAPLSTTSVSRRGGGISLTDNTMPTTFSDTTLSATMFTTATTVQNTTNNFFGLCPCRQSLSGTTTIYLIALAVFTVSGMTAYGFISSRRAR